LTASKKKLVIMLYDGAAKNLKLAKLAIEDKKIERVNILIIKTQNILVELMSSLNFEDGGDVANNLMALYEYMYQKTIRANIDKNSEILDEIIGYLQELSDTWSQI
jgi:flagellar protein FliS